MKEQSRTIVCPATDQTIRTTPVAERDGSAWQYRYDTEDGNLTDPEGNVASYSYDVDHNVAYKTELGVGPTLLACGVDPVSNRLTVPGMGAMPASGQADVATGGRERADQGVRFPALIPGRRWGAFFLDIFSAE